MILLLKLTLAHLAGDFLLQPRSWVQDKELRKFKSPKLYLHIVVHAALIFLLVLDPAMWPALIIIVGSHYAIDLAKVILQRPHTRTAWFVADQALHLGVIFSVWFFTIRPEISLFRDAASAWLVVTAIFFLTNPASVIIRTVISQWTPDTLQKVNASLPDAGKFIGFLERLLVFTFILLDHWEAVGFLLAAKSVFRFGDLRESHDRKLTEYVLIGTLLSFGIAIFVAVITNALLK